MKIALTATDQPKAQEAHAELSKRYDIVDAIDADIIIALGGDGLMLQCLKKSMDTHQKIFGMHCGSVGFLMNNYIRQETIVWTIFFFHFDIAFTQIIENTL